jgi:hypothetical protein
MKASPEWLAIRCVRRYWQAWAAENPRNRNEVSLMHKQGEIALTDPVFDPQPRQISWRCSGLSTPDRLI